MNEVIFRDLGTVDYPKARELQLDLNLKRQSDEIPDTVLFCEHPAVITTGRGFERTPSPILAPPHVPVIAIERGGLATYHGPGQLVVYPIIKMDRKASVPAKHGVVDLIRFLEAWVIETLRQYGLPTQAIPEKTGVWTLEEKKIASIGIALKRWVSLHGLSVNLSVDPMAWTWLNPCGFSASDMTDLATATGRPVSLPAFTAEMKRTFRQLWRADSHPSRALPDNHP
jgi:lipoyl(octanoyl) transferase